MTGFDTPGWLGLLRVYRYERGRKGRPYSMRQLSVDTQLSYALITETFKGVIRPDLDMINRLIEALDIPAEDATTIRSGIEPTTVLEFRTDAQILADAINNLAAAIREHTRTLDRD